MNLLIINKMKKLKEELYKIHCRNWIQGKSNGTGNCGITLEKLLGKKADVNALPDYNGIEIKTKSIFSDYPITLFNCTLDSRALENQRLVNKYGYPDKNNPQYKVFNSAVNARVYKQRGKYFLKLKVDYNEKKLKLLIMYKRTLTEVNEMSWSFEELKLRLYTKLQYLVLVNTRRDRVNGIEYFKYDMPIFYVLKDFETFLKLIEKDVIYVEFKLGYDKTPEKYGQLKDSGTSFCIYKENLPRLFDEIKI